MLNAKEYNNKIRQQSILPAAALDSPMDWDYYKASPLAFQRLYMENLRDKYGATQAEVAGIFGVVPSTISKYCSDPLRVTFFKRARKSAEQMEMFDKFKCKEYVRKRVDYDPQLSPEENLNYTSTPSVSIAQRTEGGSSPMIDRMPIVLDSVEPVVSARPEKIEPRTKMDSVRISFTGAIYVDDIMKKLKVFVDDGNPAEVFISIDFAKESA